MENQKWSQCPALIFWIGTGHWRGALVLTFPSPERMPTLAPGEPSRGPRCIKGHWRARRVLFLFPHPGSLPRIQLPSPRAHTARTPRPKEVGPKEVGPKAGSGILPFLQGFLGQMCIRTLKRKGAAELRRIFGRDRRSGFAGDRGSDGYRERLGSKAPSSETLPSFSSEAFTSLDGSRRAC